ncbi:pantoate--beta-alanine ligase [Metabacillus malikii]|uniref:Pantothenate synthetase n=1 Tax=Metabacillus malikii TaxID=1504265 RepID=A0ABT9ZAZ9_9BACI|nr:pantoate--beta-alanine ligase [Metabacillus malikii]MDQ0228783.1 pantoate--beta-alanine ligase [Metabacillus malikii]
MIVVKTVQELKDNIWAYKQGNQTIGFVPTMGYLHEGHRRLLEEARKENDIVVLSVFVNPLQFGVGEDYESYPRDEERDEEVAKKAGVDVLFLPPVQEMYPTNPSYSVSVKSRVNVLCGKTRAGHFDGVATVLTKLFNLILPDRAYFGMKDAQQVAVVEGLVKEFNFPLVVIPVETMREEDGLAKSSRNVYLTSHERHEAPTIYRSLLQAKRAILEGCHNQEEIKSVIKAEIQSKTSGQIDYIEILSYPELSELMKLKGRIIIAVAVKFSKARLIDNITFQL